MLQQIFVLDIEHRWKEHSPVIINYIDKMPAKLKKAQRNCSSMGRGECTLFNNEPVRERHDLQHLKQSRLGCTHFLLFLYKVNFALWRESKREREQVRKVGGREVGR